MTDLVVVLCTCAKEEEGLRIAETLVKERLAACVNLLPPVRSIYRWQGAIERATEALLIIKTSQPSLPALRDRIVQLHSYDTPELVALPVTDGLEKYMAWWREQL